MTKAIIFANAARTAPGMIASPNYKSHIAIYLYDLLNLARKNILFLRTMAVAITMRQRETTRLTIVDVISLATIK